MTTKEAIKAITKKYIDAGFEKDPHNEYVYKFKNKFSVHFLYVFNDFKDIEENRANYENIFSEDFLTTNYFSDLYWNYYSIYYVNVAEESVVDHRKRDVIENDTNMSRKFVINSNQLNNLPPIYYKPDQSHLKRFDSVWEDQWSQSIGNEFYIDLVESSKGKIMELLKGWLNAELNKNN